VIGKYDGTWRRFSKSSRGKDLKIPYEDYGLSIELI